MSDLATLLESFTKLDGVHGALLLDGEGAIREEHFAVERDSGPVAEMVRRSAQAGAQLVAALGKKAMTQEYVEFADAQVTAEMLQGGSTLVIVADTGANLGRIRLEIRKNKKSVEACLD